VAVLEEQAEEQEWCQHIFGTEDRRDEQAAESSSGIQERVGGCELNVSKGGRAWRPPR
jgi:hypothetical protein